MCEKRIARFSREMSRADFGEQFLTARLAVGGDFERSRETSGAAFRVDQINETVLRAEKAGASSNIRIAHENVRRNSLAGRAALLEALDAVEHAYIIDGHHRVAAAAAVAAPHVSAIASTKGSLRKYSDWVGTVEVPRSGVLVFGSAPSNNARKGCRFNRWVIR